jgi:DNA-binding response OmpR family regulator
MDNKGKILIVEDEPFLSEMYQTKFVGLGYTVVTAENGQEGIDKMRSEKPTLVLLDVIMPEMDGYEVLRRVRKDEDLKDQLIVVFSNLGQDEEITKGIQMGADDYLIKSNLTPSQLAEKIEAVIKRGHIPGTKPQDIRVLLITEDRDVAEQYSARFKQEAFLPRVVEHGVYGLKVAQSEPYDVIVVDTSMVNNDFDGAISILKQTPKLKDIPIIALTEDGSEQKKRELLVAGAEHVYLKPRLTINQLVNHIRELVNQK